MVSPTENKDDFSYNDDFSYDIDSSVEETTRYKNKNENETTKKIKNVDKFHHTERQPIFDNKLYYDSKMIPIKTKIEELQPQLNEMYDKAVRFNQDYDLSLIAEVQKNIQAYENRLSKKSTWGYITHLFSKIVGVFHTSQEPSKADAAVNLMTNLWHFKLSSDQKKIVEALVKSRPDGYKGTTEVEGFEYHGTFRDGVHGEIPEGKGYISYKTGEPYKHYNGYFLNGKPHGQGELTYGANSSNSSYRGQFEDGKPHGKGRLVDKKGTIYIGEFQNGKPHGKVKIIYEKSDFIGAEESRYVLCRDGKCIQGIIIFNDKSRFIGYFDENEHPYRGVLTKNTGDKSEFVDGEVKFYNGTHPNRDGSTLEYKNGLPFEGFLFNNLNEKLEYREARPYEGILTTPDGSKVIYVGGSKILDGKYWDESIDKTDHPREYKNGQPFNGIFAYPNGEELVYVNGKPYNGTLFQLDGKHLTYRDGELLNATTYYTISGEKIEYRGGQPYQGILVKPDGTRIRYQLGELFNGIERVKSTELEYRDGRPYQGTLLYPESEFKLEYVNGMPYKGVLIKENGDQVLYRVETLKDKQSILNKIEDSI